MNNERLIVMCLLFNIQKILLNVFYVIFFFKKKNYDYVVGVREACGILSSISSSLKNSFSVCDLNDKYYSLNYDVNFNINKNLKIIRRFIYVIFAPILLAYLTRASKNFIYVQQNGFLIQNCDARFYEFNFLKKKKIKIITFFLGNDIRSHKKTMILQKKIKRKLFSSFDQFANPYRLTDNFEKNQKLIANTADQYSDLIFSWKYDQLGYLKKKTLPINYFIKNQKSNVVNKKFRDLKKINIVHASSSYLYKGTEVIIKVLKSLKKQGYNISFKIFSEIENTKLRKFLKKKCHIAIGQLYSLTPGVFPTEAMMDNCAVLTSASHKYEPMLQGKKTPWIVVDENSLEKKLKDLLINKKKIQLIANNCNKWAIKFHSYDSSKKILNNNLEKLQASNTRLNNY